MYYQLCSGTVSGVNGYLVSVEVDVANGFPKFDLVGLAHLSIKESVERVRAAIRNLGYTLPYKRITVNLAPAELRKQGTQFDLPVAIGILMASQQIMAKSTSQSDDELLMIGELSLQGQVRKVRGALAIVEAGLAKGIKKVILPIDNLAEVSFYKNVEFIGVSCLAEVVTYLEKGIIPKRQKITVSPSLLTRKDRKDCPLALEDIRGQQMAKRAIQIAITGRHHLLFIGPPGTGKSMLAQSMPTLLPEMTLAEQIEVTRIYSAAGQLNEEHPLVRCRPFRAPHHTITQSALIGGGYPLMPGEISLAHKGVLFLDEIGEFKRPLLEVLRKPLEEKEIRLCRHYESSSFPADFLLVGAMNPCPCGYYPDQQKCHCSPRQIARYHHKLSGPILDRLDLFVEVNRLTYDQLTAEPIESNCSLKLKNERVTDTIERAWQHQQERFSKKRLMSDGIRDEEKMVSHEIFFNSQIPAAEVEKYCCLTTAAETMMATAYKRYHFSVRHYHRLLRLSRTIADMDNQAMIDCRHLAEALAYRQAYHTYFGKG